MRRGLNRLISALTPATIRRSYALKFVVSIMLVIVVISSVGAFGYAQARDTVVDGTEDQLRSTAEGRAQSVGIWLEDKRSLVRTLSADNDLRGSDFEEVQSFLAEKQSTIATDVEGTEAPALQVTDMYVVNTADGVVVASTNTSVRYTGLSTFDPDPWATASVYGGLSETEVWTSPRVYSAAAGGERVLAFASPVPGTDRALVVVGRFGDQLRNVYQVGGDAEAGIVASGVGPVTEGSAAVVGEGSAGEYATDATTASIRDTGEDLHAYAAVPGSDQGWVVVTAVSKAQAFTVADTVGQIIGLIIGLGLVSLGLVGFVLGRQTVTPLARLRRKVERMEGGDLEVDLSTGRADEIGRLYGGFDAMRNSLRDEIRRTRETNRHLEAKADEYSDVMRDAAAGDLTRRMDPSAENDAMADVAAEFNEMIADLEATTAEVKAFASQVALASQEVTASADTVRDASEQVTESVEEIADGAERQDRNLQSVTREMTDLRETIDDIADSTSEVAAVAEQTVETGREGRAAAREAYDRMERVTDDSETAVAEIRRLEAEVEQVDELIEFVNGIARQTNMLALNANIEATRSSDAGDGGFGAIATEIKELSEEAQEATENVEGRLERIREQTGDAADVVEQTSRRIQDSAADVGAAAEALEEITTYAERTNEGVQSIDEANEGQVVSASGVADAVEDVARISAETAETSETVARLAQRQTAATSRMSGSATELSGRAERLRSTLEGFATDVDDAGSEGDGPDADEAGAAPGDAPVGFDPESGDGGDAGSEGDGPDADEAGAAPDDAPVGFDPDAADGDGAGTTGFDPDAADGDAEPTSPWSFPAENGEGAGDDEDGDGGGAIDAFAPDPVDDDADD